MIQEKDHCCTMMRSCIDDPGLPLFYSATKRRYYMPLVYQHRQQSIQALHSCPWCATVLPKDLGEEYYDILEKEYGLKLDIETDTSGLPDEFKSDLWWKRRNL